MTNPRDLVDPALQPEYDNIMSEAEVSPPREPEKSKRGRPAARDLIRKLAVEAGVELGIARSGARIEVARWRVGEHYESGLVYGSGFRRHLMTLAYRNNVHASRNAIDETLDSFAAQAYAEGREVQVMNRAARMSRVGRDGASLLYNVENIIVDEGRSDWRLRVITPEGHDLIGNFAPFTPWPIRGPAFLPLPEPKAGGSIDDIFEFINVDPDERILILAFMLHCWRPGLASPVQVFMGEQGSAKSSSVRAERAFIDPSSAPLSPLPKDAGEAFILAASERVLAIDNLSHLDAEQSDALAMIATGAARKVRRLYSDSDVSIVHAQCPIILNTISDLIVRGDLAERSIINSAPRIDPAARRSDSEIAADMERQAPFIYGAWLDCVAATLATLPSVQLEKRGRIRLADFSDTGEALARTLGYEPGYFDALVSENQGQIAAAVLDASALAGTVQRFVYDRVQVEMAPGALLEALSAKAGDHARAQAWPRTPSALSSALRRLAPALRDAGIVVDFRRTHQGRFIYMALQKEIADAADTPTRGVL